MIRDRLLEFAIRAVLKIYLAAYWTQRWAGETHKKLIAVRSPEQVARMESRRGLR